MTIRLLRKFEASRPFSQDEAWLLFRLGALGEAGGWSLLILGILIKRFILHGNDVPVLIAGQIHGTIFILYIVAALGLYPSLGWSRKRAIIAGIASVPPFGSLLFEQWAAYKRSRRSWHQHRSLQLYQTVLMSKLPQTSE